MDMNGQKKFLILSLVVLAALSFFLGHFWSYTVCALQRVVATGFVPLFVFSKLVPGVAHVPFLL
jgi:hypothetical protein